MKIRFSFSEILRYIASIPNTPSGRLLDEMTYSMPTGVSRTGPLRASQKDRIDRVIIGRNQINLYITSALLSLCVLTQCGDGNEEETIEGIGVQPDGEVGAIGYNGQPVECPDMPSVPGLTTRAVDVGGIQRSYLLYIPESLEAQSPVPLLLVFHPFGLSAELMRQLTRFDLLGEEEGFIAVFPEGTNVLMPWNVGRGVCGAGALVGGNADDFGFVEAILDDIEAEHCIDPSKVFATGFSMGAYFTNNLGCQQGELLRAIAPHSGGTYPGDCTSNPMPVLLIHGTADWVVATDCGIQARDQWVQRNGCSTDFDIIPIKGGQCEQHRDCPPDGQVTLCLLDDMCHGWAGIGNGTCVDSGGGEAYEDASHLVWNFFQEQF